MEEHPLEPPCTEVAHQSENLEAGVQEEGVVELGPAFTVEPKEALEQPEIEPEGAETIETVKKTEEILNEIKSETQLGNQPDNEQTELLVPRADEEPLQHTPKKLAQDLQQLTSELRQKTRSQQKAGNRGIQHEYIYNHNCVLLSERLENVDFDENYFTRASRVYKKKGHQESSLKKKRQTGAGECCICYGRPP